MTRDEILSLAGMPPGNPSYPFGPYRFIDREYLNIIYETDAAAIRAMVPEPLAPDGSNTVVYEWINMPDSSGFGAYQESGVVTTRATGTHSSCRQRRTVTATRSRRHSASRR